MAERNQKGLLPSVAVLRIASVRERKPAKKKKKNVYCPDSHVYIFIAVLGSLKLVLDIK